MSNENNQHLAQALQTHGITVNSTNVELFPTINGIPNEHIFLMHGSADEINQILPQVLDAVADLEGQASINLMRNDLMTCIPQLSLGQSPTL